MIIATVTAIMILFHGGAGMFSFSIFEKGVKQEIADQTRAKQIRKIIDEADDEIKAFTKGLNKDAKELLDLTTNFDTSREALSRFALRADQDRDEFQERLIKLRMQIKSLTTEDEWTAIYAETRARQKK